MPDETYAILVEIKASIDQAVAAFTSMQTKIKDTETKTKSMSDTFKTAAGVMIRDFARDAFGAVISSAGEASKTFQDYELTLTKIVGATSAVGSEATQLESDLAAVSLQQTDLGFSAREASEALEALVKAGMSGSEAAEALRAALSLARLENIDTDTAANYLVQTLTQFNLTASDSAGALDLISKAADAGIGTADDYASGLSNAGAAAANMGVSLEDTLGTLVILDKTYGSATESGTYLNAMFKDLIAKSDDLGISLYNSDGSMRSLDEIVQQIKGNVQDFGTDQEAVNEYLSVFDIRAQKAVLGLINYDGSISETVVSMGEARDVQDKVNMTMDTTAGKMSILTAEQENVNYQFGEMTAELDMTWKQFSLGLGPIGAVVGALGPSMLQGAFNALMIIIPQLIVKYGLAGTAAGVMAAAQTAAATASGVLTAAMGALGTAFHFIVDHPIILVLAAIAAALIYAYENCPPFRDAINAIAGVLAGALGTALEAITAAFQWLWDNVLAPLGEFLIGVFLGAWNALSGGIQYAWDNILMPVWNALKFVWDNILAPLAEFFVNYFLLQFQALAAGLDAAYNNVLVPIWDALNWVWDNLLAPLAGWFIEQLLVAWQQLSSGMQAAYDNIIEPIWNALNAVWDNVLAPFGHFLVDVLLAAWNTLSSSLAWAYDNLIMPVFNSVQWFWDNVLAPFGNFLTGVLLAAWNTLCSGLKWAYDNVLQPVWNALSSVYNSVLKPIADILGTIGNALGGVTDAIGGGLSGAWDVISGALGLAEGGIVYKPTLAVVGESGPEAVIPLNRISDVGTANKLELPNKIGSSAPVSIQVTISGNTFASEINVKKAVREALEESVSELMNQGYWMVR